MSLKCYVYKLTDVHVLFTTHTGVNDNGLLLLLLYISLRKG